MTQGLRICSLLPSATEIVYALGLDDALVAVTHECDFPPEAAEKPQVTVSLIDSASLTSAQIDQAVRDSLETAATIYALDEDELRELQPDLILTQELCTVCAVGSGTVREVAQALPGDPKIVSLEPRTMAGVMDSILQVGRLTGTMRRAIEMVDSLRERLQAVRDAVSGSPSVTVLTLEWIDPVFVGGHWVPEMVEMAGGRDVLGVAGAPSREASWAEVVASRPQVVIAMPCGFGLERSISEIEGAQLPDQWVEIPAVSQGQVYAVDGSSYFNRPGPRLIDGVEILASILHPDAFGRFAPGSFARVDSPVGSV